MEQVSRTFCYADANLIREEQHRSVLQFVDFWHGLTGTDPQWLYLDSKFTTYAELSELMQRDGLSFVTIRRRGSAILKRLAELPSSSWKPAVIDIPKRRHQRVQYVDVDTVLTVLANGCYRWLASRLHGFSQSQPKGLYRKFVETSGAVKIEEGGRLVV